MKENHVEDLVSIGRYKIDQDYDISQFSDQSFSKLVIFDQGFELIIKKTNDGTNYALKRNIYVLSPFFLLTFEKNENQSLRLISIRSLIFLISITLKKYIDDSLSNTLILKWKNEELQIICFNNNDVHKFIEILGQSHKVPIIKNLKKTKYNKPIKLKDVISTKYNNIDQHELESTILVLEQSLQHEKLNDTNNPETVEKIKDLMELYRKVICCF